MSALPATPDLRIVDPKGRPVMDLAGDVAYCRRCGTRLGVVCPGLAGIVPAPVPHRTRADCRAAGVVSA